MAKTKTNDLEVLRANLKSAEQRRQREVTAAQKKIDEAKAIFDAADAPRQNYLAAIRACEELQYSHDQNVDNAAAELKRVFNPFVTPGRNRLTAEHARTLDAYRVREFGDSNRDEINSRAAEIRSRIQQLDTLHLDAT